MDPNTTLSELRELITAEEAAGDGSYSAEICERFRALDEWLSRGGFRPAEWSGEARGGI